MIINRIEQSPFGVPYIRLLKDNAEMKVLCLSQTCETRARELLIAEPEIIVWLDSISNSDLLIDVGANIGIYSLYAAIFRHASVFSIEPDLENHRALFLNSIANNIGNLIRVYPFASGSTSQISNLYISNLCEAGGSMNSIDKDLDSRLRPVTRPRLSRVVYKMRLDDLQSEIHGEKIFLKVDVDGFERQVILGGTNLLQNCDRLSSIYIELDMALEDHLQTIKLIESFGFTYSEKQVSDSNIHIRTKWPEFSSLANFIFYRK